MNRIKEIYLLFLIVIGLVSLSVYSTYALFTASVEIDEVVEFEATISTDNSIMEYETITMGPGEVKIVEVNITNSYGSNLYYGVWYSIVNSSSDVDLNIGVYSSKDDTLPSGYISNGTTETLLVGIQNYGNSSLTINLGSISSLTSNLGLDDSRNILPYGWSPITYTITYYLGNGTNSGGATKLGETECYYNAPCELSTFTNLGGIFPYSALDNAATGKTNHYWDFYGWVKDSTSSLVRTYVDGETFTYTDEDDIDLYAMGVKTFSFYDYDESTGKSILLSSTNQYWNPYSTNSSQLDEIDIPSVSAPSSWTFIGFRGENTDVNSTVDFDSSLAGTAYDSSYNTLSSYYAKYKRTMTVSYNNNGGSGTTSSQTIDQFFNSGPLDSTPIRSNVLFTLKEPTVFTKEGYGITKWLENSTSGTEYYPGGTYNGLDNDVTNTTVSATMYAYWDVVPGCTISANPSSWTNGNVILTVNVTNTDMTLASSPYSWTSAVSGFSTTATKTVSSNGTYTAYVKSSDNKVGSCSYVVDKIDGTESPPNCTISGNPTNWTNSAITLTVNASDNSNAFDENPYSWTSDSSGFGTSTTKTVTANDTYTAYVKDAAGNVGSCSVEVTKYDVTPPECTISGNPTSLTSNDVVLTVSGTDNSGSLNATPYSWTSGTSGFSTTATKTISSNGTYTAYVKDAAGNVGSCTVAVDKIDQEEPTCTISGNPSSWTNQNVELSVSGTDNSGSLASSPYSWTSDTSGFSTTTTKTVSSNDTYTAYVKDSVGNVGSCSVEVKKIDKVIPKRSWSLDANGSSNPYCSGIKLTVTCTDTGGSGVNYVQMNDAGTISTGYPSSSTPNKASTYQYLNTVRSSSNKKATSVTCVDNAGNYADPNPGTRYYTIVAKKYDCYKSYDMCPDNYYTYSGGSYDCRKKTTTSCNLCSSYTSNSTCTSTNNCNWRGGSQMTCYSYDASNTYHPCHSCPSGYTWNDSRTSSSNACYKWVYKNYSQCNSSAWTDSGGKCWQYGLSTCPSGSTSSFAGNCSTG